MSADLRDRLHRTAVRPARPVDLDAITAGIARRRRRRTASATAALVATVVAVSLAVTQPWLASRTVIIDAVDSPTPPDAAAHPGADDTRALARLQAEQVRLQTEIRRVEVQLAELEQRRLGLEAAQADGADVTGNLAALLAQRDVLAEQVSTLHADLEAVTDEWNKAAGAVDLTVSSIEPFPWAVVLSATDEGRWCATAIRGSADIDDTVDRTCDPPVTPPEGHDITWHGSQPDRWPGTPTEGLSWGLAPGDTRQILVEFTDGSRSQAQLAGDQSADVTLWAIAYENVDIKTIAALGDGWTTNAVPLVGFDGPKSLGLLVSLAGIVAVFVVARRLSHHKRR